MVRGISSNTPIVIRCPEAVRPWQHVLEPLSGYLLLGQKLYQDGSPYAGAWNFGPSVDDSIPVVDVAERVRTIWGKGDLRIQPDPNAPHETTQLRLNCAKSSQYLGWRPRLRLAQALEWTVDWYRAFYEGSSLSPRAMTERQIHAYMQASAL
jgi:CDP-glucose 4,6-dehydratase